MSKLLSLLALFSCAVLTTATGYDYIVAGAGSSGCIIAERLSRDSRNKVLVLDSGEDYTGSIFTTPSLYKSLSPPPVDQLELVEHMLTYEYPEGVSLKSFITKYALGGASAMNGNFIQRVSKRDLDTWAQLVSDPVWSFANTLLDYKNIEKWNSSDPTNGHGKTGPITMQTFEERKVLIHDLILGALSSATGVPVSADSNLGNIEVASLGARSIAAGTSQTGEGTRQDTFSRVLKPKLPSRPNLTLRSGCKVTRIKFKTKQNKPPVAEKLQFICDGETEEEKADKEIILALGVFNSAQLLLLSGIGPSAHLLSKGIPVIVNNPHVGQHLTGNVGNVMAFAYVGTLFGLPSLGLPNGVLMNVNYKSDPSQTRADMEISVSCFRPDQYPLSPFDVCSPLLVQNIVDTEGSVTLRNRNPLDQVNVTYGFFKNPLKLLPMVDAFKKARAAFAQIPLPFSEAIPGTTKVPLTASDQDILTYIMTSSQAEWHDVGTCRMSATQADGVVDSRLRVWGVKGLRVADQSVVRIPYEGHCAASGAILIGSVAGRLILEDN